MTRIETVEAGADGIDVWVDTELEHCDAVWREARMIGRVSTAHTALARLRPTSDPRRLVELPGDVRSGDLAV